MYIASFTRRFTSNKLALIAALAFYPFLSLAEPDKLLSDTSYHDPNGFFNITPPAGWKVTQYPDDPRGKVKFVAPGVRGVSLLIIAMATDMSSIDDVMKSSRKSEARLKNKYQRLKPSAGYAIKNWHGQQAVEGYFELPNRIRQESVEFLVGNQYYNPSYAAPPSKFSKYKEQAMLSIRSLEPLLKKISSSDARKHLAASKLRLAKLNLQLGYNKVALRAIRDGLELDPENVELLNIKNSIGK